ncbi:DUF423 domain-containing protein [Lysinibacillus sp. YS11]|jgi:uncharacterized membrane protein YgdD (TMEM256/DUF423 family)|uniref:DUF423 domain-containing protein n=1 Tax=Lysinibacillus TaxID=400634 RepID=UPI000CA270C6|nr:MULTISPECIES: DUF423 domain-containing protein [Lysinibacillus]AUS85270.1 DUF423 domain-containing protein [Lysinibacillus sp. YS11]MED3875914.1 DUF423 domain-containing protein [Lysinibacillus capsici]MED4553752.1 DUF423 domain-containing protein [Lysinibacillus capsici]WBF56680.1 DUF423 domain-containing protein [Lysinibacillus sp. JK80]WPK05949.1 DUF423 domain-containing protein [Lysinibacillus capsici]
MKRFIVTGALHGLLAVAFGAFGAHALKEILDEYSQGIWETAVQYQMFHATGLLIIGLLMSSKLLGEVKQLNLAGIFFNLGIVFFSGSLYVLAISGIKVLGAITPIGGVLFLAGWLLIILTALKHAR